MQTVPNTIESRAITSEWLSAVLVSTQKESRSWKRRLAKSLNHIFEIHHQECINVLQNDVLPSLHPAMPITQIFDMLKKLAIYSNHNRQYQKDFQWGTDNTLFFQIRREFYENLRNLNRRNNSSRSLEKYLELTQSLQFRSGSAPTSFAFIWGPLWNAHS